MPLLIQYGRSAFVGRFAADLTPDRGAVVVIESARGIELGTCFGPVEDRFASQLDDDGRVLRTATGQDLADARTADELADTILQAAASDQVTFLDCEVTLDRRGAVLHAVPWGECDLDPLLAGLSDRFGLAVRLLDVRRMGVTKDPPEPKTTCDKPDCGSGGGCGTGGGCSSGGCGRKQVKSAEELTAYFADLRQKMEAGRVPLN
ncbi:MAG: hypothetical protein MUF18_10390 [Fimbriiglobus sp.]|jgi:hypothetical protein|nr:hypothetical protein [Fimbriiglobus sp.]